MIIAERIKFLPHLFAVLLASVLVLHFSGILELATTADIFAGIGVVILVANHICQSVQSRELEVLTGRMEADLTKPEDVQMARMRDFFTRDNDAAHRAEEVDVSRKIQQLRKEGLID